MQVGHVQGIHQNEITIKPHERAGVDGQGGDPAGGRQNKGGRLDATLWKQGPRQSSPGGYDQLGQDAGRRHLQALHAVGQSPGLVGVGVRHGPHHQKRYAHCWHAAAKALGRESMPQLVQEFDQEQGDAISEQAVQIESVHQGCTEALPAAHHLRQTHQQSPGRQPGKPGGEEQIGHWQPPGQPGIGPDQGHTKKQIVVQQPLEWAALHLGQAGSHFSGCVSALGLNQLVYHQKFNHRHHVLSRQGQRRSL